MEKTKLAFTFIGIGIVIGAVIVVLFLILGARFTKINLGPIELEMPTPTSVPQLTKDSFSPPTSQPTPHVVPTAPDATQPTSPAQPTDTPEIVLSKCQWIQANLPQSQEAIAAKFGLPVSRVQVLREGCGDTIDGFVVRGGTDTEYTSEVEMQVPEGGCIDAPTDAGFTGHHEQKPWGIRAYSGIVRAMVMTYWPWCDELH